jgi:hypothetical protein
VPRGRSLALTALTLALVLGAAAAFVQTQVLKAERPALRPQGFEDRLTPECRCPRAVGRLSVRLPEAQRISAAIVDEDEQLVRTLAMNDFRGGGTTTFLWSGRDDAGALVPDGRYRLKVDLTDPARAVVVPRPITVGTAP